MPSIFESEEENRTDNANINRTAALWLEEERKSSTRRTQSMEDDDEDGDASSGEHQVAPNVEEANDETDSENTDPIPAKERSSDFSAECKSDEENDPV